VWFAFEAKNKSNSNNNGNILVASPFGLCSGLRQSGSRFAAGFRPKAEALLYLGKGKGNNKCKDNSRSPSGMTTREATHPQNGN
jgi:hypothetical protein